MEGMGSVVHRDKVHGLHAPVAQTAGFVFHNAHDDIAPGEIGDVFDGKFRHLLVIMLVLIPGHHIQSQLLAQLALHSHGSQIPQRMGGNGNFARLLREPARFQMNGSHGEGVFIYSGENVRLVLFLLSNIDIAQGFGHAQLGDLVPVFDGLHLLRCGIVEADEIVAGIINCDVHEVLQQTHAQGRHRRKHGGGEDDANDGDQCPGAVFPEGTPGQPVHDVHRITSSRMMRPSSMARIRSACNAMDSSWVMTMRV